MTQADTSLSDRLRDMEARLADVADRAARFEGYAGMLQNICARQDGELQSLSSGLSVAQAQLTQALDDKRHQAQLISSLRDQVAGQQTEIAELRLQVQRLVDEKAGLADMATMALERERLAMLEVKVTRSYATEHGYDLAEIDRRVAAASADAMRPRIERPRPDASGSWGGSG